MVMMMVMLMMMMMMMVVVVVVMMMMMMMCGLCFKRCARCVRAPSIREFPPRSRQWN